MRKITSAIVLTFLLLLTPSLIFAQTSTPSVKPQQRRLQAQERVIEKNEERQQLQEERRATIEARLTAARRARIQAYWARLNRRFMAVISRLEMLIERIQSRLAKIEEINPDTDTANIHEQLDEASLVLASIKTDLDGVNAAFEEALSSEDPKSAYDEIREMIAEIKQDLIEVHRTLVKVIGDIKGLRVGQFVTTRLTPTPTP